MNKKTILVVGGAGYIGSYVNHLLHKSGYETIVLDNLSTGNRAAVIEGTFINGDMGDRTLLDKIFSSHKIDAVMDFAAHTDVGESVKNPLKYYLNNVSNTLQLLKAMVDHHVKLFIFSSTASLYGHPKTRFITEQTPCDPMNPYGETKLVIENILRDLDTTGGLRYCSLRYFNAAGGDPEGKLKNYNRSSSNLIPRILHSIIEHNSTITINGTDYETPDGTCVRDYIHIADLASAHILAMEQLFSGGSSAYYNLGNGKGFSVREVIAAAEKATGKNLQVIEGPRRPGDPATTVADSQKAQRELGWKPQYPDLETIIAHAWQALTK